MLPEWETQTTAKNLQDACKGDQQRVCRADPGFGGRGGCSGGWLVEGLEGLEGIRGVGSECSTLGRTILVRVRILELVMVDGFCWGLVEVGG